MRAHAWDNRLTHMGRDSCKGPYVEGKQGWKGGLMKDLADVQAVGQRLNRFLSKRARGDAPNKGFREKKGSQPKP